MIGPTQYVFPFCNPESQVAKVKDGFAARKRSLSIYDLRLTDARQAEEEVLVFLRIVDAGSRQVASTNSLIGA